jgi:DNA repair exonuclease SbcCD nuclease subunit
MNNILLFSDLHICQSSLKECIFILEEIGMLANKYNVDTLINLGDTFDGLKPSSKELDVFATFIRRLGNKQHIILAADSHESTTQEESVLNHYGILSDNITIVKEFKDGNHLYCGHYVIKESKAGYGAKLSKVNLKDYLYVFLGHQHSYEVIKPNICHLGSVRYVDFAEAQDKVKIVALITGYGTDKEEIHFLKLKSPIPMQELKLGKNILNLAQNNPFPGPDSEKGKAMDDPKSSISQAQTTPESSQIGILCQTLDKLPAKTKVKVKILDFESYREFLPFVNKYSAKFEVFKYDSSFEITSNFV